MFSDAELIDVIERADVHHYERPAQVQGWLQRKHVILEHLNNAFLEHCGIFGTGLLSTIVSYLTPEHFHYTWRPQIQLVDRTSAAAMNRTTSKFGGDHPFLLEGEEQGPKCEDGETMTFLMQLLDEDLPEAVRGVYVPDELRGPGKRAMLQLWIGIGCGCFMREAVMHGARWIDCSGVSLDNALEPPGPHWMRNEQRYVFYHASRLRYSPCSATDIPMIQGWHEPETDQPHIDEEYHYDEEIDLHPERCTRRPDKIYDESYRSMPYDSTHFDKLSGFGEWPNSIRVQRCPECDSICEFVFQLGSDGESWSERFLQSDSLFLFSCPKHRNRVHYIAQGT